MAIEFNCPYCHEPHRLKNEYAGKRALCKNPGCRQVVVIPQPVTVPEDKPARSAAEDKPARPTADLEAAALSALTDEPVAKSTPVEQVIAMTCTFCEHKWTEPFSKAGKNTLCPNPECRQRQKVPESKADEPQDWRQTRTRLPSGAKQNFEKLEGVQDAAQSKMVSGTALREADATGIEIEPRTLKEKMVIAMSALGIVAALGFGVWYLTRSRTEALDDRLLTNARKEFDEASGSLSPTTAAFGSALLHAAAGEFDVGHRTPEKLVAARSSFNAALKAMNNVAGPERELVATELASIAIGLGGSDDEVKQQVRYRWRPSLSSGKLTINEKEATVHDELVNVLSLFPIADPGARNKSYDLRMAVARRLARELAAKGQADLAVDNLPVALFDGTPPILGGTEQTEAKADVAIELFRINPSSELARRIDDELTPPNGPGAPRKPYVQILHAVISKDKKGLPRLGSEGDLAIIGVMALEGNSDDALKAAVSHGTPEARLRALVMCAEWSAAPGPALEGAHAIVTANKGNPNVAFSPHHLLRLSQLAATAGSAEQSAAFAGAIADDGIRAWARGDAVRLRLAASPREKGDLTALETPDDPKAIMVGHFWGALWIARHNTIHSGDRAGEAKNIAAWPTAIRPFGLAGIALGLKDR